ncbi:hypothetical protein K438DRAFT_1987764 [Mycena galopus ATCC 62051]|nr:hypothetical protein K438DRAFT_1987764 [Mycena galopus ATCC 62051]
MAPKLKRAAATSAKAKRVAAISAAEAKEDADAPPPLKKPRGRRPKKVPEPISEEDDELEDVEATDAAAAVEEKIDNVMLEWTDELTWVMITAIESNEEIRDGLYPGVGAIKRAGGLPKTHFYYKVAEACFAEHPLYKDAFAIDLDQSPALLAQHRKPWIEKIRNRDNTLKTKAKVNIATMGQTGAGLESAEDIEPGSGIATKWDLIQADSPWFFNMRNLIAARPNLQPVGLGNNDSPFDIDLLLRTHDGDDASSATADDTADLPSRLSDAVEISDDSDDDDKDLVAVTKKPKADDLEPKEDSADDKELLVGPTLAGSIKRKRKTVDLKPKDEKPAKKTKPQPATSLPATPALAVAKKPTNAKDRFSATILAEEETAQLALGLKREKNTAQKEVALAKIRADTEIRLAKAKAKADTKREERAAKLEILRLKMQNEHQLHMAQMQHAGPSSMSFMGAGGSSHGGSQFTSMYDGLPRLPTPSRDMDFGHGIDDTHFTQR